MPSADSTPIEMHAPATVDAYAAIESQYVYRGVALRDRPTASLAVSGRFEGWFVDAWNGLVDDRRAYGSYYYTSNDTEWDLDVSAGYGAAFNEQWQWSLACARIVDLAGNGPSDSYTEWRANLFYLDAIRAQIAYSDDYLQRGWSSWNAEVSGSHPLTNSVRGEWGIGHSHGSGLSDTDYEYGWLGVSGLALRTHWDVRWIDAGADARYVAGANAAGSRVVASLSWSMRLLP